MVPHGRAKTARSQAIGGMIFGVSAALDEDMVLDKRYGMYVNNDLAQYHVPVHADMPDVDAISCRNSTTRRTR
jgi:xanthine dehydrogenase YagR molybdenum-binding subunit